MKKKTIIRIVLGVVIAIVLVAVGMGIKIYNHIEGSEKISGKQDSVPETKESYTPIEKSEADWTSWHGPNYDKKSTYTGINKNWSSGLTKKWDINFLCQGKRTASWSAPVVQGNRLIVPGRDVTNDIIFCLNPENGKLIWKYEYEAETGTNHGPGARATPFIDDDRVYTFGRNGDLICLKLYDGKLLWKTNVMDFGGEEPNFGHSSSPLVYDDKVYVQGGGKALALAFDKMSGELAWKSLEGPAGYAPPTIYKSGENIQILFFHGTALSGLNPDNGKELWNIPWATDHSINASLPVYENNTVFITSGYGQGCQAIKLTGDKAKTLWTNLSIEGQHTDPVILNGYVYGYSGESSQNDGSLKCIRLSDGKEMWSSNEAGYGTLVFADGHLICMDIEGNLHLIEANPKKFVKVSEMKNAIADVKNPNWVTPILANGKLYLRYMQKLICYDI